MFCTVISAPRWLSRMVQCSQQPWSHLLTLRWRDWTDDAVQDHSELLLFVDDFRFSEPSHERQCFESVSSSHWEHRRCWNQCSRHPSQGWTHPRHHDFWDNNFLALCAIFLPQVAPFDRDFSGRVFLPLCWVAPICRKNWVLLATYQQSLGWQVAPFDLQWVWGIGLAWKNQIEVFLQVTVERVCQLVDVQLQNPDHFLYSNWDRVSKGSLVVTRRQVLFFIQFFNLSIFTIQ